MKKITKILYITLVMLLPLAGLFYATFYKLQDANQLFNIISFAILFVVSSTLSYLIARKKDLTLKDSLLCIFFLVFVTFNFLNVTDMLLLPKKTLVANFSQRSLEEALEYSKKYGVNLNIIYEYSDNIPEYFVISQSIQPGEVLDKSKKINLIVSQGADPSKAVIVPNMIGWDTEKVTKFVASNFLSNVNVNFTKSEEKRNTVTMQNRNGEMKRNDTLDLTFSLGTEDLTDPVELVDFTGKTLFEARMWLKQNGIAEELKYSFNEDFKTYALESSSFNNKNYKKNSQKKELKFVDKNGNTLDISKFKKGNVLEQNIAVGEMVTPGQNTVTLTISKGKKIIAKNFLNMSIDEVTSFVIANKLKIKYLDKYDDTAPAGKVISSSIKEGDVIEEGTEIVITSSKGQLKMEKQDSLEAFKAWANKYGIPFEEVRENNNDVPEGQVIKYSHTEGQIIKNGEKITVYISKGKPVTVPSFANKSRAQISNEINSLGLSVKYVYSSSFSNTAKDICISQSIASGNVVDRGTQITITLSKGPGITIPNFVGLSRADAQAKANSLGLKISFVEGSYSNHAAGTCVSQNVGAGKKVDAGARITVTVSKGQAKSITVSIQSNWLVPGNATASGNAIKRHLENALPGAIVQIRYVQTNGDGVGLPASGSVVTLTQGQTTVVSIYK